MSEPSPPTDAKGPAHAFNWRDVVVISPAFTAEQRTAIEQSLEHIAHVPGGEGEALIRGAAQRNGGRLPIEVGSEGSHFDDNAFHVRAVNGKRKLIKGELAIDFSQALTVTADDGSHVHLSVTGVMVHELFHANDYSTTAEALHTTIRSAVEVGLNALPETQRKALATELNTMDDEWLLRAFGKPGSVTAQMVSEYDHAGFHAVASYLRQADATQLHKALVDAGVYHAAGERSWEYAATKFTDHFMHKYFGEAEPIRHTYANAVESSGTAQPTHVPQPLGYALPDDGFKAKYSMPAPTDVPPLPEVLASNGGEYPIATRRPTDPRALLSGVNLSCAGVKHDVGAPPHDAATESSPATYAQPAMAQKLQR